MGQEYAQQIVRSMGVYDDKKVQDYVSRLGMGMATKSERPKLPWAFYVMDDPTVNAFALPGGSIFVTRGILTHMNNEAELVGVLGHEIGHVTARHSVQQMTRAADRPDRRRRGQHPLVRRREVRGTGEPGPRRALPQVRARRGEPVGPARLQVHGARRLRPASDGQHVHDPAAGEPARGGRRHPRVGFYPPGSRQPGRGHDEAPGHAVGAGSRSSGTDARRTCRSSPE